MWHLRIPGTAVPGYFRHLFGTQKRSLSVGDELAEFWPFKGPHQNGFQPSLSGLRLTLYVDPALPYWATFGRPFRDSERLRLIATLTRPPPRVFLRKGVIPWDLARVMAQECDSKGDSGE